MNIYVGNLYFEVNESDLKQIMDEFGVVSSVKIIKDRETGKSKGYGFVEMNNDNEAKNAIQALNGKILMERAMVMKEATMRAR